MASLQDQLLKAGIVDKKKAKKIKLNKHTASKKQPKGQVKVDENKLQVEKERAERVAKDKAMNKELKLKAEKKAIQAQIIQLIKSHAIEHHKGELSYQFTDGSVIKKLFVSDLQKKQLSNGILAIARLNDGYEMVPAIVAEKISQRDTEVIVLLNDNVKTEIDEDDPYADYQIPDDLMW